MKWTKVKKKTPSFDYSIYDNFDLTSLKRLDKSHSVSAVYFLFNNDELVYIGMSKNVFYRIKTHLLEKSKIFTNWAYIELPINDLSNIEAMFIKKYMPIYNNDVTARRARIDKEFYDSLPAIYEYNNQKYKHILNEYFERNGLLNEIIK